MVEKSKKKGLGKGLSALFGDEAVSKTKADKKDNKDLTNSSQNGTMIIKTTLIEPNSKQPRKTFNEELLKELTDSVKQYGILQPILVTKHGATYEIIAGERRWRAAVKAGLKEVPVVVRELSDSEAMEISIIENIQRADLNPIEEAMGYQTLMKEYKLTQEEVADKVAKNRTTITNMLRLLKLDERVQQLMISGELSSGHARTLLSIEDGETQKKVADEIIAKKLSVREVEKLVKSLSKKPKKKTDKDDRDYSVFFREYEDKMRSVLGTKVHINRKDKNKGRIEIDYYSSAELDRIMELIKSIN